MSRAGAGRSAATDRSIEFTQTIVEAGQSGTDPHRPVFRRMIQEALAPSSNVAAIVVHHTSRFSRDATEARVIKRSLRKAGVRVVSVCQEIHDDPVGHLVEGIFECIDEYESEVNGIRTSSALDELTRQGFFASPRPPYGFTRESVEVRPGVVRHRLIPSDGEAVVVRELFQLYIAGAGAKGVARTLNQRGYTYRGRPWSKDRVLYVLTNPVVAGTFVWRRHRTRKGRAPAEPIEIAVPPIIEGEVYDLAQEARSVRNPARSPGRGVSPSCALKGLLRCGKCGAAYQLETSGKKVADGVYAYCYYNCRTTLRVGKERCPGYRIRTQHLDDAVLSTLADAICTPARAKALASRLAANSTASTMEPMVTAWRASITRNTQVGWNYLQHLLVRIMVHENRIVLVPKDIHKPEGETEPENAPS